jgi:hypothetical protein
MPLFGIRIETIHVGFDTGGKNHRPLNQLATLISIRA